MLESGDSDLPRQPELGSDAAVRKLRDGVLYLLRRELRNNALADDICNEAFRIVIERLKRRPLDDPSGLGAYVVQTARNLALMDRRKMQRRKTQTGAQDAIDDVAAGEEMDPSRILESQTRAAAVHRVLREIREPGDREILVRVYLYDQDKERVCRELGIDARHYKHVIHQARERFRDLLRRRFRRSDLYCFVLA